MLKEKNELVVLFCKRDYKFPHGILVSSYDASKVLRQKVDDKCFAFLPFYRYCSFVTMITVDNNLFLSYKF